MKKTALSWIYRISKKFIPGILLITLLSAVSSVGYIILAIASKGIIDVATGDASGTIRFWTIVLLAVVLVEIINGYVSSYMRVRIQSKMDMHLKDRLLNSYIKKQYKSIYRIHSGEVVNKLSADVELVTSGVVGILPRIVSIFTRIILGIGALIYLDATLALIVIAFGVLLAFTSRIYSKKFKHLHKQMQQTNGEIRSFIQECAENVVVVKSFATNQPVRQRLFAKMKENLKIKLKRNSVSNIANAAISLVFTGGYYITLAWGALQISLGIMTYGTLMGLLQIVTQIRTPLYNVSGIFPQIFSMIASAERLIELENLPNENMGNSLPAQETYTELRCLHGKNLQFAYDDETVLSGGEFTVQKGQIAIITGDSGVGKSTLFRVLLGLFTPSSGTLTLETRAGEIPVGPDTRMLFSYVPQGNMILSGTIRENIAFCRGNATNEEIEQAAKAAMIYDFINSLPKGFDTELGERGLGLSEGQIQRIAIARALLSTAPILLLDEATSALDEKTERALLENIKAMENRTVILITHRTAALEICDTTIHIENGKIM